MTCCLFFTMVKGQTTILIRHADKDTAYIREYYRKHFIVRAYELTKFNNFKLIDGPDRLLFKPNDHNNIGVGFIYRFISLNLGFYVPFIDKNRDIYGKTRDLDLQSHLYVDRFIVDIYGQFYHGYYLSNTGSSIDNFPGHVLVRPDISTRNLSMTVQYVYNDKRFSYNAPFYQNERQKKSAGSLLIGGGIYHFNSSADSAFTPVNTRYSDFFNNYRFNTTGNTGIGLNAGYAYTGVIKKWFYITGMLGGGAGINRAELGDTYTGQTMEKVGPELTITGKLALGYNSDKYFAGVTYTRLITENNGVAPDTWQEVNSGNFRFTVAERFRLKKSLIPKSDLIKIE